MTARVLPVLEMVPPSAAEPATPPVPAARLAEFDTLGGLLPRFHVWTLGCQMNRSDSEEMAGALLAAGCEEATGLEDARLIVINTCAIREAAEQKVIGRMGWLSARKRADPGLRVVLTGCAVREQGMEALRRRFPSVDLFLRPEEEPELVPRLGLGSATSPGLLAAGATDIITARARAVAGGRIARSVGPRAWLPIVYGCDKTCTYCIVPVSRGPERSRPFDDILAEADALARAGYREVTLLGQNVNSWGHDLPADDRFAGVRSNRVIGRRQRRDGRPDIAALLAAIDGIRGRDGRPSIPRLRFVTSHPWDLGPRLIEAMAACPSVCEHLHLPVQSGDDGVLRRMGRQYTVGAYLGLVERLRAAVPGISLTTDVIVGFCGETEEAFRRTLDLLRTVRFDQVFAAAYSPRPGTAAARLPDDVPAAEKRRRLNELLAVQEAIGAENNAAWLGRTVEVLIEDARPPRAHEHETEDEPDPSGVSTVQRPARSAGGRGDGGALRLSGRTRQHTLVHLDGPAELVGTLVDVVVERSGPYALAGSLVAPGGR